MENDNRAKSVDIVKETFGYGRIMFMISGIGVPLAFTLVFNKCRFMRKLKK